MEKIQGEIIAIGNEFTNEKGEKQVPFYTRDANGVMIPNFVNTGTDESVVTANADLDNDIAVAIEDIRANENSPEAIEYYKKELQTQYGDAAIVKLDANLAQ